MKPVFAALSCLVSLYFASISIDAAFSEASRPTLTIGNINFLPTADGFYDTNVGVYLRRPSGHQINFNLNISHVRSLAEVYDKLKPAIEQLADEVQKAELDRPNLLDDPNVLKNSNILK
jgi:hypothetical protein